VRLRGRDSNPDYLIQSQPEGSHGYKDFAQPCGFGTVPLPYFVWPILGFWGLWCTRFVPAAPSL